MVLFNWLHLTDLHWRMEGARGLWPNVEEDFFDDLEYLVENEVGPLDLVLFTGDLVQRGSHNEFEKVTLLLERFWNKFHMLGFDPKLLTVPGNHDLTRPDNLLDSALVTLMNTWDLPVVQKPFWDKPESDQRKVVDTAFANYVQWWRDTPIHRPIAYSIGMLPGDFSATIEKDGAKLGIVGLNSSFLQLTGGDLKGKLALNVRQFNAACGGHGPDWSRKHDVCLLLTHHPPTWLNKEAQEHLNGEIHHPPQRFALHLFGHMHEANLTSLAEDGSDARNRLQGRSLFGMEGWGSESTERMHGYSLGQLKIDDHVAELRIWPRNAVKKPSGGWTIDRDVANFALPRGQEETKPILVELLRSQLKPPRPQHETNGKRVFISHSSKDKMFVERLIADLRNAGVDIWLDKAEIGVGDSIIEKINAGLNESDYVAVVLSPNSISSRWVQQELNAAYISSLDKQNKVVLPILIENVEIPPLIRDRHYADFRTDYNAGLNALLNVLRQETDAVPPTPRVTKPCALTMMSQAQLRRTLNTRTSLEEIKLICFDLDIDYESLRGETKGEKIVELVMYLKNRQNLQALIEWLSEERPDLC